MNAKVSLTGCVLITLIFAIRCKAPPKVATSDSLEENILKPSLIRKDTLIYKTSLINLISTPGNYNKKVIQVKGFLDFEPEGYAIYLNKEDFELNIFKNAIWININSTKLPIEQFLHCDKQYVIIEGMFEKSDLGNRDNFSGAIDKITRIELLGRVPGPVKTN